MHYFWGEQLRMKLRFADVSLDEAGDGVQGFCPSTHRLWEWISQFMSGRCIRSLWLKLVSDAKLVRTSGPPSGCRATSLARGTLAAAARGHGGRPRSKGAQRGGGHGEGD